MILPSDEQAIRRAAELIRAGGIVAVPTETVYGLAGDATKGEAVARIFAAKGRPSFNPLIVHVGGIAEAEALADWPPVAHRLAKAFWPGPLTLVLQTRTGSPVAALATSGLQTIAIRMPAHPIMRALIAAADVPLAAPSANASGRLSPTRAEHVAASLGDDVPVLNAGPTRHGVESTIVAVEADHLRLLRPGPIDVDALEAAAGLSVHTAGANMIEAPGQLASHYAPTKPLRLNAIERHSDEWLIGFGAVAGDDSLSASGDLIEAASKLFEALHRADQMKAPAIAVAPIPLEGIGIAINDRLKRAATPASG